MNNEQSAVRLRYLDSIAGGGKTYSANSHVASNASADDYKYIVAQPSMLLIDQTLSDMQTRFPDVQATAIHSANVGKNKRPVACVIEHFKKSASLPMGEVLYVSHAALSCLPEGIKETFGKRWNLIVDEVPGATSCITYNHGIPTGIRRSVKIIPEGAAYARVKATNHALWKRISQGKTKSAALLAFKDLAGALLNPHQSVYVLLSQWSVCSEQERQTSFFTVLNPSIFENFAGRPTIMSAGFQDTLLYRLWTGAGVMFDEHRQLGNAVRASEHTNGHLLTISYVLDEDWSKKKRDTMACVGSTKTVQEAMRDAAISLFGDDHVYMCNKDSEDLFECVGHHLPNSPWGLNEYQHIDNAVVYSALNLTPAHIKFLDARGVTSDEIRGAITYQATYQAIMRTSLRDIDSTTQKHVIVQDLGCAEYLAKLFPGCSMQKLDAGIAIKTGRKDSKGRGRNVSDAQRKTALRLEQKMRLEMGVRLVNELASKVSHNTNRVQDLWDKNDAANSTIDPPLASQQPSDNLKIGMSLFENLHAKKPTGVIEWHGPDQFINWLRECSENVFETKHANQLISPSIFDPQRAIDANDLNVHGKHKVKGRINVVSAIGIWLDNDGGDLSKEELLNLFPHLRMVIYSTFSSTPEMPKYRVFIPTTCAMTAELYMHVTEQLKQVIEQAGGGGRSEAWLRNWGKKWAREHNGVETSWRPYRNHGFDWTKTFPENMMYLPCKAGTSPEASFFEDHNDGRREPLNVMHFITHSILHETPDPEPIEITITKPAVLDLSHITDPKLLAISQAIQNQNAQTFASAQTQRVTTAIALVRQTKEHQGDDALFRFGLALAHAGLELSDIKVHLENEAVTMPSSSDRKAQGKRIIDWLRKHGF